MLAEIVREAARRFGGAPALVPEHGRPVSFEELDARSDRVAAGLRSGGVAPEAVVALVMPSGADYVTGYVAVAKLGATTVGVNPRLTPAERARALEVVAPNHAIVGPGLSEGIPAGTRVVPGLPESDRPLAVLPVPRPSAAGGCIVLTSGTTGVPRGAVFTDRQLAAVASMDWDDRWGGGPPQLVATEMAHVGFMTKLPWYLRSSGAMHLLERWAPGAALDVIERERIPVVGGIAAQIAMLLRDPSFDRRDLSHVRLIVAGGGPSSPALVREARRRFGAGYSIRYSSTESGGLGTLTDPDSDDPAEIASVGRPRAGIDLEVRADDGTALPSGAPGEIWLRSPAAMSGYHRDPAATSRTIVDGWLRTGDVGETDAQGRLRLVGRTAERYRRGGYFVYPAEVEAVLQEHPSVADVAIVPRHDEVLGESGVAVVVPADAASPPTLEELRVFARDRLASFKLPEALRLSERLPYTPMHKIDRRGLAATVAREPRAAPTGRRP